jgi:hypothetical protein
MNSEQDHAPLKRSDMIVIGAYCVATVLVYFFLHGIYRPENMDDAWFLSFAHNHVVNGVESDVAFGAEPGQGGFGGVMLFGKSFSHLYGTILNSVGWTKSAAHKVSTLCVLLSATCWIGVLSKLGFSRRLAVFFGAALLLLEPFFGAANQARPDALSFLIVSGSSLCFVSRRYFLAGVLATVAIEIHPVGISALLFMGSVVIAPPARIAKEKTASLKAFLWFAAGLGVGILYYLALHAYNLGLLPLVLTQGNTGGSAVNNILFEYFFKTKHFRHIPELIIIITSAGWYFFHRYDRENRFIPIFLIASLLFTVIIRRPNFMYTIYVYPAFLLLIFWTFERHGRLLLVAVLLLVYLLPQYALVFVQNRSWDMGQYLSDVCALTPEDGSPIVGQPNDWFAFPNRTFYATDYRGDFRAIAPKVFVLVESDAFRRGAYPALKSVVDDLYSSSELGSFQSRGETVILRKMVRNNHETGEQSAAPLPSAPTGPSEGTR